MLISRATLTAIRNLPANSSHLYSPRSIFKHDIHKNMKVRSCTVSALAVMASSVSFSGAFAPSRPALSLRHYSPSHGSVLQQAASVMAEGETRLPLGDNNSDDDVLGDSMSMAKGTVVSFFKGGLTAVKIDDDQRKDKTVERINALNPAKVPIDDKFKSDSGGDLTGHKVRFPNGKHGVVVAHRPPIAFVYNGLETMEVSDGTVSVLKDMATISVRDEKKVVGWDGSPVDATAADNAVARFGITSDRAIFARIPQVKDIALINTPMLTGNTMIDTLAPIGQGQNMLLVEDDVSAARGMICDFIKTQQRNAFSGEGKKPMKFVYAAIDDSDDVTKRLKAAGVSDDVHVVVSSLTAKSNVEEAAKAAEATAMASAACAIAESYALEQGMNTVVIVDSLDQHKALWDATTRTLVDVFGMDSVVKSDREGGASSEMRGFFSSIVQRSAQYKASRGGGSVTLLLLMKLPDTADDDENTIYKESDFESGSEKVKTRIQLLASKGIPLTAATLRKLEIPIPSASEGKRRLVLQHIDDLISMSDGQIWLDKKLREAGQNPPVDPQRSITRIGIGADTQSRADAPALRRIAEGLRLAFSQAANMEGAEETTASKKQLRQRNTLLLAMHQESGQGGRTLSESCIAIMAATNGFLDDAIDSGKLGGTEAGQKIMDDLLESVRKSAPDALASIDDSLDLSDDAKKEVLSAIESFFSA